jgi:hypothetical protein
MNLGKIAAVATLFAALIAAAIGIGAPANAQNIVLTYHSGHWRHHHHYYHPVAWTPGPGYVRRSWAWYSARPAWWRHEHPYHGQPGVSVYVHL